MVCHKGFVAVARGPQISKALPRSTGYARRYLNKNKIVKHNVEWDSVRDRGGCGLFVLFLVDLFRCGVGGKQRDMIDFTDDYR